MGSASAIQKKADDWQVVCTGIGALGIIISAGIARFVFFSKSADVAARFQLAGTGKGLGGNATGAPLDDDDWSSIDCSGWQGLSQPFSVLDLHGTGGFLATMGVGAAVGWGPMYISAGPKLPETNKPFFSVQNVGGFSLGVGASALSLNGSWKYLGVSGHRPLA
ncbi:hypothetical protein [Methylobacterium sp. J-090]|uniref:hypothetical protein n=1 Tax=Methylobacterium sp. J-090 TaxID=2836666 RepID=UPI001FBBF43A|nr:hypothetical protein [Methylobacterium sp. J-090]MCJ2083354.1 hypothetical protein [Methylobacterium sp. J-090]